MPPRIGILGFGRFGRALAALAEAAGTEVRAFDPAIRPPAPLALDSAEELAREAECIVLAVPVADTRRALETLKPHLGRRHLVLDVGSVKTGPIAAMTEVLGETVPWVGTHPLFGPTSLTLGTLLTVVICPNPLHPEAAGRARRMFEGWGCRVAERDADSHDRIMAQTHALAFFVAKGMLDAGVGGDPALAPPSFQAILRAIEAVRSDAAHLFTAIQAQNPYAAAARRRLLEALTTVDRSLATLEAGGGQATASSPPLIIPDLGTPSPELLETRDLIDAADRELMTLLARRAGLAHRAGVVKAGMGHGMRDPVREEASLQARRDWAVDAGLDPDSVEDVFRAILRFSWRVQGNP